MNLVNEGVLPPNELDDRDERREEREVAQGRETVTDIVADIRERAYNATRHGERTTDNYAVSELLKSIADRIETAWKREARAIATEHAVLPAVCITKPSGNAAATREALVKCREIALQWQADEADGVAGTTDKPQARSAAEAVIDMEFEINAALAAPARNCDVYNHDEALNVWAAEKENERNGCFDEWLYEPAAERKGEGYGR